ncbi:hypothetical protein [Halobacteriovorax sp.]|uniref:hypothetical protein n=1 Tax=Halobacteriovorax sp. TaxID=2020862 RepID=UPI00356B04F9
MYHENKYNSITSKHYLNPGKNLNDLDLMRLYGAMIEINIQGKQNVDNLYLKEGLPLEKVREIYNECIITLFSDKDSHFGFLVSPILKSNNYTVMHAGLIIFSRNPGGDFMSLATLSNFTMAYEAYGKVLVTNITSTPSIIEVFTNSVSYAWPSPKMNIKLTPKGYRAAIKMLEDEYMKKYFPSNSDVKIDLKRFTMTSNSNEMGFSTDYYKLSRANKYIYQAFCKTWIDYSKSEDVIQVGQINFLTYLQQRVKLTLLKYKLQRVIKRKENRPIENKLKHAA